MCECVHACACAIRVHVHLLAVFSHFFQLIRLVANLSIHPEVGPAVARDEDTVDYLLQILGEPMVLRELERERERGKEGEREQGVGGREMKGQPHTHSYLYLYTMHNHTLAYTLTHTQVICLSQTTHNSLSIHWSH